MSPKLTPEEIVYNEACIFTLLTISVSMEMFYTTVVAFYLNWDKYRGALTKEKREVIMRGAPLLYKKHFIN